MNDASGETVYTYDVRNRLASKQTPFGTLSYTYDNASNLLTTRSSNANGVTVDYTYDVLNRLKTVRDNRLLTLNGGLTTYNYDAVGNLDNYVISEWSHHQLQLQLAEPADVDEHGDRSRNTVELYLHAWTSRESHGS